MVTLNRKMDEGWQTIGITLHDMNYFRRDGGFLDYDGSLSHEAVNQHYQVKNFRAHAARFAHELDAAMGHHTLASASEDDRLTVHRTLAAMIGSAERRYKEWELVDEQELIVGGTYDGTLLWKRYREDYEAIDTGLCGQCDIATFARRFLLHADLPAFRRSWRQGTIYMPDRSTTPWSPAIYDAAPGSVEDFYDQLDGNYSDMLFHYDNVVGAAVHPE